MPNSEHNDSANVPTETKRISHGSQKEQDSGDGSTILLESGRVEAFSDGVIAIAITLLALDLKVPVGNPGTIGATLLAQWPAYIAYLASFIYIGVIWINHHSLFTRIRKVNNGLLWRNLVLLLPVSILPFPTATLAYAMQHGNLNDQHAAIGLYGFIAAAMGATWLIVFTYLDNNRVLLHENVPTGFFRLERDRALFGIAGPIVANVIGIVFPIAALAIFLLLPLFYAFTTEGWAKRRRSR